MARSIVSDYLHNLRFHVTAVDPGDSTNDVLGAKVDGTTHKPDAGFKAMDLPQMTISSVVYREGIWIYERKYAGVPTFNNVKMSRGVARGDTAFLRWMLKTAEGTGQYRTDLKIYIYHRDSSMTLRNNTSTGTTNEPTLQHLTDTTAKIITLHDAFPVIHTLGSPLDAASAEVSIMDLEVAYERITVETTAVSGTAVPIANGPA